MAHLIFLGGNSPHFDFLCNFDCWNRSSVPMISNNLNSLNDRLIVKNEDEEEKKRKSRYLFHSYPAKKVSACLRVHMTLSKWQYAFPLSEITEPASHIVNNKEAKKSENKSTNWFFGLLLNFWEKEPQWEKLTYARKHAQHTEHKPNNTKKESETNGQNEHTNERFYLRSEKKGNGRSPSSFIGSISMVKQMRNICFLFLVICYLLKLNWFHYEAHLYGKYLDRLEKNSGQFDSDS